MTQYLIDPHKVVQTNKSYNLYTTEMIKSIQNNTQHKSNCNKATFCYKFS